MSKTELEPANTMNPLAVDGRLDIRLFPDRPRGSRVEIVSSRPLQAANILIYKTPARALEILPALYAVCGIAQARALLAAIQRSQSMPVPAAAEAARDMLVLLETAREHSIRIALDWPRLFELAADRGALDATRDRSGHFGRALFGDSGAFGLHSRLQPDVARLELLIEELESDLQQWLFGDTLAQWRTMRTGAQFERWVRAGEGIAARSLACAFEPGWQMQGAAECPHLPPTGADELLSRLNRADAESFIAAPEWRGEPRETSTLTRQRNHPLVRALLRACGNALITRWAARLVELAQIPQQLRRLLGRLDDGDETGIAGSGTGDGVAQVEAVRGRLVHRVRIEDGVITRFQLLAPTEWNFHPRGALSKSLDGLQPAQPEQLEKLARLVIDAIDPCVGYELSVH